MLKNPNIKGCYIFDLDGTIADCEHRRVRATTTDNKINWKIFLNPELVIQDLPNKKVIDYFNYLTHHAKKEVFILSGREESLKDITLQWFAKNNIWGYQDLIMRKSGDYRSDIEVKTEMLNNHILQLYKPELFIDDRESVVNNWRRLGYECWQVAEGKF